MNGIILEREMTDKERKFLINLLKKAPSNFKRWMRGAQNAFVLWAVSLLGMVLVWLFLAWLGQLAVNIDFGIKSHYAIWVVIFFAPLCGFYASYSSFIWVKAWPDDRKALRQDIGGGKVIDERYKVTDVMRFQEPEHGGLIYFLRLDDDRLLVLYDHESMELEMDGKGALASSFKPCRDLHITRAPNTGYFLNQEFSGEQVPLLDPIDLTVSPDHWPEPESWCQIPWSELKSRLSV